jgi:signal transduction histidine kinase
VKVRDAAATAVLAGGGELGRRMRAIDWSRTALGPVEAWPQSLRTCVRIVLTSQQPMFVWWGDQLINLYNDAYRSILGGKHPEALGQPASAVWREIWDDVGPRAAKAMRENEGTFDEALLLIMERNGYREETYYTFSYSPVPGDAGGPGGILCANSSDTARIFGERQQALLREVAARTASSRTVAEACERACAAFATDRKDLPFALLYVVEDGVLRLHGTTAIAADSPLVPHTIGPTDASVWPVAEVLAGAPVAVRELVADGLPCGEWPEPPSRAAAFAVPAADRSLAAVLVIGLNPFRLLGGDYQRFLDLLAIQIGNAIASARTFEAERRRAEALAELDRAKTTFFSNVSHEFRTPLTLMLGPTEDALRAGEPLAGDALRAVHRNELRLLKLVNALLDFSRIEAGRFRVRPQPTDLGRITRELASAFQSAMERAGLRYEVACPDTDAPVSIDREMWERIVLNLLSNALKFTFDGGVRVALAQHGGVAELVVADTGTGIPDAELPRLFERFHRVEHARSRTHEGSGIGLALTAELVKLHDGTIEVDSAVGRGTRFTVRVPARAVAAADAQADAPVQRSPGVTAFVEEAQRWLPDRGEAAVATTAAFGPPTGAAGDVDATILVADDNADMRDYMARLLGARWHVQITTDGVTALAAARARRPDLVLTDVMMPNLDGFGLLRALRDDPALATIPVVMLSARAGEDSRIEGIAAGADDYLVKPFSARELITRVSNMLQLARLRREVELERNRLASFIEQTPVGVVLWEGEELRCGLCNDAYRRMIRRPLELGDRLADVLPELVGTASYARVAHILRTGELADVAETRIVFADPDGSERVGYYTTSHRPVSDDRGAITGVLVVATDVTEQVVARQRVEASRTEAVLANRAKDEFLAMLGHELRNPLAPIQTALELMELRAPEASVRERAVMERQTRHLTSLVDDLLDVSRIARGMVELNPTRLWLAEVIAAAVETTAPLFEQQRHELVVDVPRDLALDGDRKRLTQVFANLLTNAAKYTDAGGRVVVTAERRGDEVAVAVTDNGRGIAHDMQAQVFDLFVQERQNLDRARGGLGLGLAIVKNLIVLHGGRAEVASAGPGQGATFTVHLPARHAAATAGAPSAELDARADVATGTRSVLVVDDNGDAAALLADLLESRGYRARVAHDGPEALQLARDYIPDVALIDIGLPAMDGYELARKLRELPSWHGVTMLAVTGYGQATDRARSKAAGFDQHLVKPIHIRDLERYVPGLER